MALLPELYNEHDRLILMKRDLEESENRLRDERKRLRSEFEEVLDELSDRIRDIENDRSECSRQLGCINRVIEIYEKRSDA